MNNIKLSTPVNIPAPQKTFDFDSKITGIGSCFAQYIMEHLEELGFDVTYNPNGIVYNAVSIAKSLDYTVNDKEYIESDFINHNNLWHSWEHHGSFSEPNINRLKKDIADTKLTFKDKLAKSNLFILTPSSSVIYRLISSNLVVANCHKYPEKYFRKEILSSDDNCSAISKSIKSIKKINSNCHIIITLSPVRHYPGNLVLNARSKANLLSAIHQCIDEFKDVEYFPSYEILTDELRDYRFFKEDMLHPTKLTRKIIFQKFVSTYFTSDCQKAILEKEKELKARQHRPNNEQKTLNYEL